MIFTQNPWPTAASVLERNTAAWHQNTELFPETDELYLKGAPTSLFIVQLLLQITAVIITLVLLVVTTH